MDAASRRTLLFLALLVGCRAPAEQTPGPPPGETRAASAPDPHRLAGRWRRADSDYTIAVDGVSSDGTLIARYLNPQPIHVARAEWKQADGRLTLLVEMQDRLYPGNYYELTYDAASDDLSGVYHHLAIPQDFDVSFYRLEKGGKSAP
jgi:hypothetical protein